MCWKNPSNLGDRQTTRLELLIPVSKAGGKRDARSPRLSVKIEEPLSGAESLI